MSSFLRDERGSILIFSLILMILLFGFMGLVVDTGRSVTTHSRVQGYVDNLAVAAANELDGSPESLMRAREAVEADFIQKYSLAGVNGGEDFEVDQVMFLTDAPRTNDRSLEAADIEGLVTSNPELATHVLVTGSATDVDWGLLQFINSLGEVSSPEAFKVDTWAAASLETAFCTEPLVAMCAPADDDWSQFDPGSQLRLAKNRDETWTQGEYGIVTNITDDVDGSCSSYTGVDQLHCLLAVNNHNTVCGANTLSFTADIPNQLTGVDTYSVHAALNTRFGVFDPVLGAIAVEPGVSADANTISGALYSCTSEDFGVVSDSMGLPIDDCFHTGDCDLFSDPITLAQLHEYWEQNHPGVPYPDGLTTRYQIYQYETLAGILDPEGPEDSTANICNPNAEPVADRRRFQIAIMDCEALAEGASHEGVEPIQYVEAFLTEPVQRFDAITFDGFFEGEPIAAGDVLTSELEPRRGNGRSIDPYEELGVTFGIKLSHENSKTNKLRRQHEERNMPMVFDTVNTTGGDEDLRSTDRGNILIISEDGDSNDPDDEAKGGWFLIHFDEPTFVQSMLVFDTEQGGVIRVYDYIEEDPTGEYRTNRNGSLRKLRNSERHDPDELAHIAVPRLGDGKHTRVDIGYAGVQTIAYFMPDSGGIDDIVFDNSKVFPTGRDDITVEVIETLDNGSSAVAAFPIITN